MISLTASAESQKAVRIVARAGLISKGTVYILLGVLAFMAAFEIGGQSASQADKDGVVNFLNNSFAGIWLLPVIAAGLLCYSLWRMLQAYRCFREGEKKAKLKAFRYVFSAFAYLAVAFTAVKTLLNIQSSDSDSQQQLASGLLSQPFGQLLLGIATLIIAGIGFYQIWYGLSGKYKNHVEHLNLHKDAAGVMLSSGKAGYISRGIVWLIIAYLSARAAIYSRSDNAGSTAKALGFLEEVSFGSYLLAALGLGLMMYGFFNFVRARYEELNN